ncbi:MAG: hypothetical protein GF411_20055 [Candidatus Lokiarchaeota archaeon]|nr:hypothetical protein [Candidatus Lokiarchaeota archaeon]
MKDEIRRTFWIFIKPRDAIEEIQTLRVGKHGVAIALLITGIFTSIYSFIFGIELVNPFLPNDSELLLFAIIMIAVVLFVSGIMLITFTWIIVTAISHLLLRVQGCTGDFDSFQTGNGYALIVLAVQPIIGILLLMMLGPVDIMFAYDLISTILIRIWFGLLVSLSMKANYDCTWKQIAIAIIIALVLMSIYPLIPQYITPSFEPTT